MSRRTDLLTRAAACYEKASLYSDAARCYRDAGHMQRAAAAYARAGDLATAAECYRAGDDFAGAADLYLALGRPEDAAECWREAGDRLRAGWVLATGTRLFLQAERLLTAAPAEETGARLRRELALGVCRARGGGRADALERAILACERDLAEVRGHRQRELVETWAVQAAGLLGRHDLAARVFAASYACRTRDAARRWRSWAMVNLGDTFGVPEADGPDAADQEA
ncbi:tetratricopeptide (TPR) repeat protein [Thermocatellispora tengchongensis]|uniref:Tetratricopeptide (TPR) repeat protein n=1 Tax=Thermocatellispora tengchongensis TaxID=1073253 RepID=A0A840P928_9ACTN|nr:hypothetical protein [Thermocatellispora tengchongensis]MBB5134413.1 tetratricopeptide (TPR) repeat protein [Thermocatellispora tengchongensis]